MVEEVNEEEDSQQQQQQECSEKLEEEDSNYESMTEDNNILNNDCDFQMSPPVVSVNETSCDSITNQFNKDSTDNIVDDLPPIDPQSSQRLTEPQTSSKKASTNNRKLTSSRNGPSTMKSSSSVPQRRRNHVVQSRLNFSSRSPSPNTMAGISGSSSRPSNPALLHEGEATLEDFIINDMGNERRKRNSKQPRQSRINFMAHATNNSAAKRNRYPTSSSTMTKQRTQSRKSQGNTNQQRVPPLHDFISDDESRDTVMVASNRRSTTVNNRLSGPIFRIKVRISSHCLLVPCQQASVKTIEWLIEQVKFYRIVC